MQGGTGQQNPGTIPGSGLFAGNRVGPYVLVRELGTGGMAAVWLANRADGVIKRDVALKIPLLSEGRGDLAERFSRERDILASLEHPNIARLYDAGVGEDGLPWLALEFVAGSSLLDWCREKQLGLRDRMALLAQVVDAVGYAHGRGILHRDIKPSNVMVTTEGQVRLLDFGVARMLEAHEPLLTRAHGRALTPKFASPEQMRGEEIGPQSDIWSLGIVLEELARGQSGPRGPDADLEAIHSMATAEQAGDRYASAHAFAQDLRAWLARRPVAARNPTVLYRARKFLERNRAGAGAFAGLVLVMLAMAVALVHSWRAPAGTGGAATAMAAPVAAPTDGKSIAVLPFVDMSEHRDQEYFSDGITEELIDHLVRASELKVISRTSAFQFKGRNEDARAIGSRLGVAHLLEGSVRRSGASLRVAVELVRTSDGTQLWSQTYERDSRDVFKVQDEIAASVATSLRTVLASAAPGPGEQAGVEAYNALLRGRYLRNHFTRADTERALEEFHEATRLEPSYALAWTEIASTWSHMGRVGWAPPARAYAEARAALDRALEIAPRLALAHRLAGAIEANFHYDFAGSRAEYARARELDPNIMRDGVVDVVEMLGAGRTREAVEAARRHVISNPLDHYTRYFLAVSLYLDGEFPEAESEVRGAIALDPRAAANHFALAEILLALHRPAEAIEEARRETDPVYRLPALADTLWVVGRRADSEKALATAIDKLGKFNAYGIAHCYAQRGDFDRAFEWLDRAFANREAQLLVVRGDRIFAPMRDDPRYAELLARMKRGA